MDLSKLSQNHKITLGGGILAIISMFLPWYGFSFGGLASVSINAWSAGFLAWGGLVLAIAAAVIIVLKALETQDVTAGSLAAEQLALILAGVGVLLIILRWLTETSLVKFGLFIGLISAAIVAYGAFATMKDAGLELPIGGSDSKS